MAHEEPAGEVVGMMAGLSNPAVIGCQQVTDLGHYAHAVGAGNYQTKGSHQVSLQYPVLRRARDRAASEPMADRKRRILLAPDENFSNLAPGNPRLETNGIAVQRVVFLYN